VRTLPSALLDVAAGNRVDTFTAARRADRVLVMDEPAITEEHRIVEDGAPDGLMPRQGHFATLHRAWLSSNSPAPAGKPGRS
jgi:hypothetical protein